MRKSRIQPELPQHLVETSVEAALAEDLGEAGDITTKATVNPTHIATAHLVAREEGIVAGLSFVETAIRILDPELEIHLHVSDGERIEKAKPCATLKGRAQALLTGERVALNYLCHLSGIATLTRKYADAVAHTKSRILDTRKTTPGLRTFEKYAVRCGGGHNHRYGLFDAVLIKDNHIIAAAGLREAIASARQSVERATKIEVEVDTIEQLMTVLEHPVDAVLLDNIPPDKLRQAVELVAGRMVTEASGGVNLDTVAQIAETGVDYISVGALTHSAPVLDFGLDFELTKI